MSQRRSLGDALEITQEQVAFIQHGREPRQGEQGSASAATPRTLTSLSEEAHLPGTARSKSDISTQRPLHGGEVLPVLVGEVLVPLTTRLQPRTADALRRAYLERKLAGRRDAKQQEIVEEALTIWLREHGFLSER